MIAITVPSGAQRSSFPSMWTALSACSTTGTTSAADRRLSGTGPDGNLRKCLRHRISADLACCSENVRGADVTGDGHRHFRHRFPSGTRLTIDGRQFEVDSVDDHTQSVSLRDVTFEGGTGFPIFRKESVDYVRAQHVETAPLRWSRPQTQADEPPAVLTPPKKKKQNALAYPLDADGRNYRITDDHIGEGAPLERFQRNLDAIRTLKTVEAENRSRHRRRTGGAGAVCGLGRSGRTSLTKKILVTLN